jgi:primase-polymerase (primpol)-like protein
MTNLLLPRFEQIPEEIRQGFRWAVWKAEPRANQPGKFNKAPRSPVTGHLIGTTSPEAFSGFEDCKKAYEQGGYTGVGILLEGNGWVGVDIDNFAKIPSRQRESVSSWMAEALLKGAYVERSPSGAGLRVIFQGKFFGTGRKVGPLEIYQEKRFMTITGHAIANLAGVPSNE